jgi:hypothetical protein
LHTSVYPLVTSTHIARPEKKALYSHEPVRDHFVVGSGLRRNTMRANLFLSALFAASLFGGAALADRPGDDGGRPVRMPMVREIREMRMREVREPQVRERPHETPQTRVLREPQQMERVRARGDMVDRTGSRGASAQARAAVTSEAASVKAQRQAAKAMRRLEEKKNAVINCAPNDESCSPSARSARVAAEAGQKATQQAAAERQRVEIQKMIEKLRAERLKAVMQEKMCQKMGNLCAEKL